MPVGYLITLALVGVCTLIALIRMRRWGRLAYALTMVVNEVPHLVAVILLIAPTALAWSEGDLDGPSGPVLLAIAFLVLIGLAELLRRNLIAHSAVVTAVRAHGAEPRQRRWSRLRPVVFPFTRRPRQITRINDVSYGGHRRQRLDVLRHRDPARRGPVFVYFHGGGYYSGSKRHESRALLQHLTARGWVCISATYRLRPEAGFTDHLDDARAVLRWVHDNASVHGGDTDTVVMAGSSAGAHLTALCALTQDSADPDLPRVDAAVCLYAYYGRYYGRDENETPISTPLALDVASAPPFFIAHGDHDSWVPVEDARQLNRRLAEHSPHQPWYVEFPGAQHGFDALRSWRMEAVIDGVDAFLEHSGLNDRNRGRVDAAGMG
ncbi:acetyl esterase/lipase [Stackebrandtia endophytica]|uniref:Acetyl esterase/lipase n=1 Tax=Stackebrandtia endophytica TaxID=1496996 RepID=A0A543AVK8_9ACTN|nr:alpha/beta hydrolase [Stackebrandtia endophytica]TQL76616.1 acetyl esterase/lipase [Stackebrandtia endophytica]